MSISKKSEFRKAYLLNKYVLITPGRAARPRDIKEETVVQRPSDCPFCPEQIEQHWKDKNYIKDKIADKEDWQVLALDNIYPAVTLDNDKAYGTQEVIVETRDHLKELADLDVRQIEWVLRMWARRTRAIAKNKDIEYILCFKNQGSKAGATATHAHSQIFATKILPPDVNEELIAAQSFRIKHGVCPYCDIIAKEMASERKVYEDKHVAVFTPYASQYHYEAWITTKRHLDNITLLNDKEYRAFALAYKLILKKLAALGLSFNCFLHQVVSNRDQHFYLKIEPRAAIWAGIELGSGLVINSVPPEDAARYYRE
jgi:UDPglucose--hexose-1-phosphate uridylyltransferase